MNRLHWALWAVLCAPVVAWGQPAFVGEYTLEGRYSNRRGTEADLRISDFGATVSVSRTARFTSRRYRDLPDFVWRSDEARVEGRVLRVTYVLEQRRSGSGLVGAITPDSDEDAIFEALEDGPASILRAAYVLSEDGETLREYVLNTNRVGEHDWWRHVMTTGTRNPSEDVPTAAPGTIDAYLRDWWEDHIREHYEYAMEDADPEDMERLREDMEDDLDFDNVEVFHGDDYWVDEIDYRYDDGDPYRDDQGRAIPREDIVVRTLSFFPHYAGIGLSKTFVFRESTAEVIEEGDIQD